MYRNNTTNVKFCFQFCNYSKIQKPPINHTVLRGNYKYTVHTYNVYTLRRKCRRFKKLLSHSCHRDSVRLTSADLSLLLTLLFPRM